MHANGGGNKNNRDRWYGKLSDSQLATKLPRKNAEMDKIKNWINVVYERKGYYSDSGRRRKTKAKASAKKTSSKAKRVPTKTKSRAKKAPAKDLLAFGGDGAADEWADPFGDDTPTPATASNSGSLDLFSDGGDLMGSEVGSTDLMGDDLLGGTSTNSSGFGAAELSNLFAGSSISMTSQPQTTSFNGSSRFGSSAQQQPQQNKGALISSLGMPTQRMPQRRMIPARGPHLLQGIGAPGNAGMVPQGFPMQQRSSFPQQTGGFPQRTGGFTQQTRPSGFMGQPGGLSGMGFSRMPPRPPQPVSGPQSTVSQAVPSQPLKVGSGMGGARGMRPLNNTGLDALDPFAGMSF